MKKICVYLSLLICMIFLFSGCDDKLVNDIETAIEQELGEGAEQAEEPSAQEADTGEQKSGQTGGNMQSHTMESGLTVEKDGHYTSCDEVALYIHTYGELPGNFITKKQARRLGWESSKGNLDEVAPGKSIGGSRFGNYENQLPDGEYKECDINYTGGYRGAERLIYSEDGDIYYTDDHYATFTQLY